MKSLAILFSLILILFSCDDAPVEVNQELSRKLVGEWHNVSIKINMNSYKNSDSVRVLEITEADWETKMKIRPIRTFFKQDGTYNSEHFNLKDSLIFKPAGKWMIVGDTLSMCDTFPQPGPVYKYKLLFGDKLIELFGLEDCDNDGKVDDLYYGKQLKKP